MNLNFNINSLFNLDALSAQMRTVVETQKGIQEALDALQTRMRRIVGLKELEAFDEKMEQGLQAHEERIKALHTSLKEAKSIGQDMPALKAGVRAAVSEMELRKSKATAQIAATLDARVAQIEMELLRLGSAAELERLSARSKTHSGKEEIDAVQENLIAIRDEVLDRIEALHNETLALGTEQEERHVALLEHNRGAQERVDERTSSIEAQADEVATFLSKVRLHHASAASAASTTPATPPPPPPPPPPSPPLPPPFTATSSSIAPAAAAQLS